MKPIITRNAAWSSIRSPRTAFAARRRTQREPDLSSRTKKRGLARRFFGKGKPVTPDLPSDPKARARVVAAQKRPGAKPPEILAAGYSGAVELVTSSDTVVGEYFDPKTGAWVETTNFSIHYSEEGVFIRPEAP